ncbi:MAG: maltose ABC transporter permease MalF [Anaerolineae bacterium]
MAVTASKAGVPQGTPAFSQRDTNIVGLILKYVGLALFDALALIIIYAFLFDDNLGLALVFAVVTIGANVITLVPSLAPLRWMTPGLVLMTLFIVYPLVYTILTAFTNYGDGHLLTKDQTINLLEQRRFVPEDALLYGWTVYQEEGGGSYALWLTREGENGTVETVFAPQEREIVQVENAPEEPPATYEGFVLLDPAARTQALPTIQSLVFGEGEDTAGIANRREAARPLEQRYVYDGDSDTFTDVQNNTVYQADNEEGLFLPTTGGAPLAPGYRVNVGLENFQQLVEDSSLLEPLIQVFLWTVAFALLSVLLTFSVGLLMALVLDDPNIPARKLWRSLIFIPYAIPGVIAILVWQGMLNQNIGIITEGIDNIFGVRIPWFTNANWARVAILLVNLWLGYPYMMLITSGALQAIPKDIYEAASVDGSTGWQSFWRITLPLLLVAVGPLLIASFTFNFNNYIIIEALTEGDPPIPRTSTPAGRTDILISYTYNLAFNNDNGANYGYAAAITIVIFSIVGLITLFNTRFLRQLEEVNG